MQINPIKKRSQGKEKTANCMKCGEQFTYRNTKTWHCPKCKEGFKGLTRQSKKKDV